MKPEHIMAHLLEMNEDLNNRLMEYAMFTERVIPQDELEHLFNFIAFVKKKNLEEIDETRVRRGFAGWSWRECSDYET